MPESSQTIETAKEFAAKKFEEVGIKNHFLDVLHILQTDFGVTDTNILIAGILHDTLEDTNTEAGEIAETFSKEVADLVLEVSHPKNYKAEQKKEYYEKIKHISSGAKLIKLADFASHLRTFIGSFTGENNYSKFTHNEYCVLIRSFLESCEDSSAKRLVTELNDRLDAYIAG
jgi:(p)ppGpp synthase/HD superfamily hydrolase